MHKCHFTADGRYQCEVELTKAKQHLKESFTPIPPLEKEVLDNYLDSMLTKAYSEAMTSCRTIDDNAIFEKWWGRMMVTNNFSLATQNAMEQQKKEQLDAYNAMLTKYRFNNCNTSRVSH